MSMTNAELFAFHKTSYWTYDMCRIVHDKLSTYNRNIETLKKIHDQTLSERRSPFDIIHELKLDKK